MRVAKKEAQIRELVISGLAHLVSANTETGFKQCLLLAYHEDNMKRTIFAHVFARVIGQGTKFDPEERLPSQAKHNRLVEVCVIPSLSLTKPDSTLYQLVKQPDVNDQPGRKLMSC